MVEADNEADAEEVAIEAVNDGEGEIDCQLPTNKLAGLQLRKMFPRRIWPVDFGLAYPQGRLFRGQSWRPTPESAVTCHTLRPRIAPTMPSEAFCTQNIRILEAVFLRYIGVPEPLTRCPDGA